MAAAPEQASVKTNGSHFQNKSQTNMLCSADKMGKASLIKDRGLPEDVSGALSKSILPTILNAVICVQLNTGWMAVDDPRKDFLTYL